MKKYIPHIIIIFIFLVSVYNSGRDYYNQYVSFYKKDFNGIVLKKVVSKYTRIYYSENEYFYLNFIENAKIEEGDYLIKKDSKLVVNNTEYKLEALPSSYFYFFFGN